MQIPAAGNLHAGGIDGRKLTMKDPIVQEVRRIRDEYAAKFNYDIHAIARDLRRREKESQKKGCRLVSLEEAPSRGRKRSDETLGRGRLARRSLI